MPNSLCVQYLSDGTALLQQILLPFTQQMLHSTRYDDLGGCFAVVQTLQLTCVGSH
jgi:hypothetical protein